MAHRLEYTPERFVAQAILQRHVHGISPTSPFPSVLLRARPWEVFTKLVKTACHDTLGSVEGLLHAITVMAVDVDVEDSRVGAEKFKDAQNYVVDIAESRRFPLLCVMKTTCPVYSNVGVSRRKTLCRS